MINWGYGIPDDESVWTERDQLRCAILWATAWDGPEIQEEIAENLDAFEALIRQEGGAQEHQCRDGYIVTGYAFGAVRLEPCPICTKED
jgi:hypothetical protein